MTNRRVEVHDYEHTSTPPMAPQPPGCALNSQYADQALSSVQALPNLCGPARNSTEKRHCCLPSAADPSSSHSRHCSSLKEDKYEETGRMELHQLQKLLEILTVVSRRFGRPHTSARKLSIYPLPKSMCQTSNTADVVQPFIELGAAAALQLAGRCCGRQYKPIAMFRRGNGRVVGLLVQKGNTPRACSLAAALLLAG